MLSNKHMLSLKEEIEKALFAIGFEKATIRLTANQKDLICYQYREMYCLISFCSHPASGTLKDWVLIEYANNTDETTKLVFEDGDMIPLDLPIEQIISELKDEVLRVINS